MTSRNGLRRTQSAPRMIGQRLRRLVRLWPWRASVIAWLVVVIAVGLVRHHYSGIYGFSTANYGWLAFTLVGGSGLAWRLAGTRPVIHALVRPLLAGVAALVFCALAVTLMGLIFLPERPLQGGGATVGPLGGVLHPLGRALPVAELVTVVGYVGELTKPLWRRLRHGARPTGDRGAAVRPDPPTPVTDEASPRNH